MDKQREKQVMDQLFDEMKRGKVKTYSEMQQRKEELLSLEHSSSYKISANKVRKFVPKIIFFIFIFIGVLVAVNFFNELRMPVAQTSYNGLSAEDDPTQTETTGKSFSITTSGQKWYLTPVADYKLVAKVKSKHHIFFFEDDVALLGKYDLALAWGELIKPEYDKYIRYSQAGRRYSFFCSADCPLSVSYISNHSANNHIIAATNNVLEGVKRIKKNDIVYMEGYLVNVFGKGKDNEGIITWDTSLSRDDNSYEGGCEVFYVKKLLIGSKTYE